MTDDRGPRRRSRRRATAQQGPPPPVGQSTPDPAPAEPAPTAAPTPVSRTEPARQKKANTQSGRATSARGERDLAGPGTSQVGPTGAMRARDLNRPTAADLVEAEAELDIVRRHWAPVAEAPEPYRAPGRRRK